MLEDIKLLLGITSTEKDKLLKLLINLATEDARTISRRQDVSELEGIITQMVLFNYNRPGNERLESETNSGASYR